MAPNIPSDQGQRRAMRRDLLLLLAAICSVIFVLCADRLHANPSPRFGEGSQVRAAKQPQRLHFNLLGVDWSKVVSGHVAPEKVVAEFDIPSEYLANRKLFGFDPTKQTTSGIPISFSFPSMTGAVEAPGAATRIDAIIRAGREDHFRKGVHALIFAEGRTTRESSVDVNGLCGYVDHVHPGWAGDEFYTACKEADQTFSIICHPPFNQHRLCSDDSFLGQQIAARLIYQYPILKERFTLLASFSKLAMSFMRSRPEK